MTKKERIAILESQVADLTARLTAVEARPVTHTFMDPAPAQYPWSHDGRPSWELPYVTCSPPMDTWTGVTQTLTGNITDTCVQCPTITGATK